MRGLHELLTARFFNIDPTAAAGYRQVLEHNLNGRVPFVVTDKVISKKISAVNGALIEDTRISTESGMEVSRYNNNQDDPFINVLIIDGPMTRMGDACSYGSIDHRDIIISAANNANCVGHLFIVNTPGGTEWTHNDYQQAIDYAHSKQQPVVMWIDGICMSAGMYLASMCDEIYYMHPKDKVGCIGTMAMFYTMADGQKDFNGETYHEIYDPESFNKNQDIREIANEGKDDLLVAELATLGAEFRTAIKARFPKVKDEMIHGNIYYAEKVKGIFLNGQTDLGGAFNRTIKLAKQKGNPAAANASSVAVSGMAVNMSASATAQGTGATSENNNPKIDNMKKNYQNVAAILGIEELGVKTDSEQAVENGSFLNLEQLDAMENGIAELKAKADKLDETQKALDAQKAETDNEKAISKTRQEQIDSLQKENDALKAKQAKDESDAKAASEKATADAKADKDKALADAKAESDKTIAALNAKISEMEAAAKTANDKIAELEQSVKDKDAQIADLASNSGEQQAQGAAPDNNGTGAKQTVIAATKPVFDAQRETYAQFMERQAAWEKDHK